MASCEEDIMIEKLNNSNYGNCWFKLIMLLIKEELVGVVMELLLPEPIEEKIEKDKNVWAQINLIGKDQIINIKNETNAKNTWVYLKYIHERTNLFSNIFSYSENCIT